MARPCEITRADIMDMDAYAKVRAERRRAIVEAKKPRRIAVGPFATFYFECFDTMLYQVQEMLHVERGGEAQIADELAAYNPLIPKGRELVATFMIEIEDPFMRDRELRRLTHIENHIVLTIDGEDIAAVSESEVERTKADGKTSSIHFLHFPLTDAQAEKFKQPGCKAMLGITHENYNHMAGLPEATRAALAEDLD
jgi:predicted SnoaL-like aldol condensation-catalyzing enzyme